jgi:hypothetical protein
MDDLEQTRQGVLCPPPKNVRTDHTGRKEIGEIISGDEFFRVRSGDFFRLGGWRELVSARTARFAGVGPFYLRLGNGAGFALPFLSHRVEEAQSLVEPPADDLLALDEALDQLAAEDPAKAELVKLRCFAGLSHRDAARALGLSRATADRYWAYAKSWLYCKLYEADPEGSA